MRERIQERKTGNYVSKNSFLGLALIGIVLLVFVGVLIALQKNVIYKATDDLEHLEYLTAEQKSGITTLDQEAECLLICESEETGYDGRKLMTDVLSDMKVPYDTTTMELLSEVDLKEYKKIVLAVTDYVQFGQHEKDIKNWVREGGNLMILYPPFVDSGFREYTTIAGIREVASNPRKFTKLRFDENFMIGVADKEFAFSDAFASSLDVTLSPECTVYAESAEEDPLPLIWECKIGEGKTVVCNLGYMDKSYRGIYSASYSLLGDSFAYPVINGSTFYLDDFPSPVPLGDSKFISRDYNMSIRDFYTQVWWNDVYNLAKEYKFPYTALTIEDYSNQVDGEFKRNEDLERYRYFGNMLLGEGGEIGIHGYNHMPLVLDNFDYAGMYDTYTPWSSYESMKRAFGEVVDFTQSLYPKAKLQVYVPPSNVLSAEGLQMLKTEYPEIRAVAAIYLSGDRAFDQEFCVDEDGMIHTPRVISGYVLDDYMQFLAMSELNYHFVNTHFQHPDDVLDVDRGAEQGWAQLYNNLHNYTEWLYTSAPQIRNLTGSELAAAVERYDAVEVERIYSENKLSLELTNFFDEAYLILRINDGRSFHMEGGTFEKLTDDLYLIHAETADPEIIFE